nr:AAA family ATPase [Selenomonas ruminantium]
MAKGGVGKSTIVANMAYVLNDRYGARVLVVDNDEQGNVSQFFGGQGKYSIADVLLERVEAGEAMENTRYKGIDLIRADFGLADVNVELREMDKSGKEWQLKNALDCVAETDGRIRVKSATNRLQTIFEYSPRCMFARDMIDFVDYLLGA